MTSAAVLTLFILAGFSGMGLLGATAFVMFWSAALTLMFMLSILILLLMWLFALPGLLLARIKRGLA